MYTGRLAIGMELSSALCLGMLYQNFQTIVAIVGGIEDDHLLFMVYTKILKCQTHDRLLQTNSRPDAIRRASNGWNDNP